MVLVLCFIKRACSVIIRAMCWLVCQALYEDDEMAGGMGAPPSQAAPTEVKMPYRANFDKEKK